MSDSTSVPQHSPLHTPHPSATLPSVTDALEVRFHPLAFEECKEDASTTFALQSNRDSERKSLPLDTEKQVHAYVSQLSAQPPVTARWPSDEFRLSDSTRMQKELPEAEENDTDEGVREEAKEIRIESRHSELATTPKSDQATLARRPRTAEISGNRFEDFVREEEKSDGSGIARPPEEEKQNVPLFVNSQLFHDDSRGTDSSGNVSVNNPQAELLQDAPENAQPLLSDQEGSSDPMPPPQPPPTSPLLEEEKFELFHSEQHAVYLSQRAVVRGPLVFMDDFSEDESHPRPTDSIVNEAPQVDTQAVELFVPSESPDEAQLQAFQRQPSSEEAHSMHRVNSEEDVPVPEPQQRRISYWHCLSALKSSDLSNYMPARDTKRPRNCWQSLCRCCATQLPETKKRDCEVLLALAKRPLESESIDNSLLCGLWNFHFPDEVFVAESQVWTDIGFRSADPKTELSTLELLQMLFLATEQPATATTLLTFSRKRGATFCYALECAALTQLAIRVLRSGRLDDFISSEVSATATFNAFFLGCLRKWFSEFQRSPGRVDWTLLEARVRSRPKEVLMSSKCTLGA